MARQVNGHLGTFASIDALTAKFPPSESIGCSANVGTSIPYTKAWCDGNTWALVQAPQIQALVSEDGITGWPALSDLRRWKAGDAVLTPVGRAVDWTISNAANTTVAEVATTQPLGNYSLRLAAEAVAGQGAFATKDVAFNINTVAGMWALLNVQFRQSNGIGLTLFTSDAAALATGTGRFTATSLASTLTTSRTPVWIPKSKFTTLDGSPSWATTQNSFRVRIDSSASAARIVDFEGLFVGGGRPCVLISFDDGWATSYTAGHTQARKRGIPLAHFLIPELLDSTVTYITLAQAQEMRDAGDYLGLHGNTRWDTAPQQIAVDVAGLKAKGIDTAHAAYPEGQIGDGYTWQATQAALRAQGVKTARITGSASAPWATPVLRGLNDPLALPAYPLNNGMTQTQAKAAVDDAIASGGTVIFYAHKIDSVADSLTWATSDWTGLLDYIQQKRIEGVLDTPRWDDWYAGNV